MTILLDRLQQHQQYGAPTRQMIGDDTVTLRVHADVMRLAEELAVRDADKLMSTKMHFFMPAARCWFEWPMGPKGDMALLFQSAGGVHAGRAAFYAWKHADDDPAFTPLDVDLSAYGIRYSTFGSIAKDPVAAGSAVAKLQPVILAILALINSPKVVKRDPARLERLNKRRAAAGRYTYHPHHVVRLNVDRNQVRVSPSTGGDGATRALHFVRAHLRLWEGRYILVQPHWRGDPQVGIVKPGYEIDRQTSTWSS